MRILLSPAKKMRVDTDSFLPKALPQFLPEAKELLARMRELTYIQLKTLWKCNDAIAVLNYQRILQMDLEQNLTPALFSYDGIQYQYMAPHVLDADSLAYIEKHLRILSGLYGLLRPFDGVVPYRLEMQAKLSGKGAKNLYAFWGEKLACALCRETDFLLDLASKEYSKAVFPHLGAQIRFATCTFGEKTGGKIVEKGTLCKMARGEMVRWLAENQVTSSKDLPYFNRLGYVYSPADSTQTDYVFLKASAKQKHLD